MKVTQNCRKSFANAWISRANKPFAPFVVHADRAQTNDAAAPSDILSVRDEGFGSAVRGGLRRVRSWRVPPNWSPSDWYEELTAVGTAAAWQAVCEFDPELGVPLAAFGYCRIMGRCLARYRKEWRHALHLVASDSCKKETTPFKDPGSAASPMASANGTHPSNDDLRGAVGALPAEQRRLIEQLFWDERTETELADALGIHQSTINRRKRAILNSLRMRLRDRNESQKLCIKLLVVSNLANWLAGLTDVALGA